MAVPNKSFQPKPGGFKKPNTGGGGFNKGGFNRGRFAPRKEAEHRINHFIRATQVRLVGDNVTVGVYPTNEALKMAQAQSLDLVEISPNADPPVCKIIDYNKFLYDKKKKEKEMKELVRRAAEVVPRAAMRAVAAATGAVRPRRCARASGRHPDIQTARSDQSAGHARCAAPRRGAAGSQEATEDRGVQARIGNEL
jgi:hypothetical protein